MGPMALASRTLSREIVPAAGGTAPYLFLVLVCDRLAVPSLRLSLRGTEALAIGRGDLQRRQLRRGDDGEVALTVPDDRMSVRHATLRHVMGSWVLSDGGSRNGTFVKGRRIEREVLADGDLIELGHSFLLFRSGIVTAATDPVLLYSDELVPGASGFHTLLPSLAADFRRVEAIARSSVSVVIHGETGTGKEVVASGLHALSGRRGRFVAVKWAAWSRTDDVSGLVRSAAGGTLFLDAVEELPAAAQPLLSRVLEHAEVSPGSFTQPFAIHLLRVIAATQQDLDALATKQQFRSDLLARLSGLTLALPPLRERREDLGLLIRALVKRHAGQLAKEPALTCDAARALLLHPWPRNIRELEKDLQAALVLAGQQAVGLRHLPGK